MPTTSDRENQHDDRVIVLRRHDDQTIVLRWLGKGALPDVPARDLNIADLRAVPYTQKQLLDSGVYERVAAPVAAPEKAKEK
jgi:hypothetical protein